MNWQNRYVIIVDYGKRDVANKHAEKWDEDEGGGETFGGIRLSSDGTEPVTHTACNTKASEEMKTGIFNAADKVPFIDIYEKKEDESPVELFQRAMDEHGLQVIQPEI
jgi:hypothetical protein